MTEMYPPVMEQATEYPPLDVADRCDRCGAQAKHRHRFRTGELLLCGHHHNQHADAMLEVEVS